MNNNEKIENKEIHFYKKNRQPQKIYALIEIDVEQIKKMTGFQFYTMTDSNTDAAREYLDRAQWKCERVREKANNAEIETLADILNNISIVDGCEYGGAL